MTALDTALTPGLPLALLLAHLIGDFLLQPNAWVDDRRRHGRRSRRLVHHVLIHAGLSLLVLTLFALASPTATLVSAGFAALAIGASHWLIDLAKGRLDHRWPSRPLTIFILDQALHGAVIVMIWLFWSRSLAPLTQAATAITSPKALGLLVAYVIVTRPMSIAIAMLMGPLSSQLDAPGTLSQAGARIGVLERLLVLTLTLFDQLTAVGFLLAAKSVLRFGDLKESRDRKLTEYVLLGTLASVTSTLVLGLLLRLWWGPTL